MVIKGFVLAAAVGGVAALFGTPANAQGHRFCLSGPSTGEVYKCDYDSWAACQTTLNGVGGDCRPNFRYRDEEQEGPFGWSGYPRR